MTKVKRLKFKVTYKDSQILKIDNLLICLISYDHLIKAKKSSGRSKDLDDLKNLRKKK